MSPSVAKVYIDTSVFIYYLHSGKTETGFQKAETFFKEIEKGNYKASTSTFTKFEYRGYLKQRRAEIAGHDANRNELDALGDDLDRLLEDFGVDLLSTEVALGQNWVQECGEVIDKSCPLQRGSKWFVMRGADIVHALIAAKVGIKELATFDNGFRSFRDSVVPKILWD